MVSAKEALIYGLPICPRRLCISYVETALLTLLRLFHGVKSEAEDIKTEISTKVQKTHFYEPNSSSKSLLRSLSLSLDLELELGS
jgi:hypothetical protein